MKITYECVTCAGSGIVEAPEDWSPIFDSSVLNDPCDVCGHTGRVKCQACMGAGKACLDGENCPDCGGDGDWKCEECGGKGYWPMRCGECGMEIDDENYHQPVAYVMDGDIVCGQCASRDERLICPDCKGTGVREVGDVTLEVGGKTRRFAVSRGASCSCCAARPHSQGDLTDTFPNEPAPWAWATWRANLRDSDGVFYSYLCGREDGREGCLETIAREQGKRKMDAVDDGLEVMEYLLRDDMDGLASLVEDLGVPVNR
jgi:hypothetical protein